MWTDIRCNMTEIYCIHQKMSTISVIMKIMFVIAMVITAAQLMLYYRGNKDKELAR